MGDAHHRYEQLAVDHVLGGLASADATAFRTHLVACRDCRRRVAELRDIAEGLEATEREEQVRHELASALGSGGAGGLLGAGAWRRAAIAAALIALVVLGFWTYHLRRVVGEYSATLAGQQAVLEIVAAGEPLEAEAIEGVRVAAAQHDDSVAVMLGDLPALPADRLLLVWLLAGDEVLSHDLVAHGTVTRETETLPFTVEVGEADELVLSIERRGQGQPGAPSEHVLARVRLAP